MYNLRREYQKNKSPMQMVTKILMNSLYGKFGQKFLDKDNLLALNHTTEQLQKFKSFEVLGNNNFIRIVEDRRPSVFCIPIWASYVTAYARLKLHDSMLLCNPVYVDTDSLITTKELPTGNLLGQLKLEYKINSGIIVKPKFYMINSDTETIIKSKGIGKKLVLQDFFKILSEGQIEYTKFAKIKESLR